MVSISSASYYVSVFVDLAFCWYSHHFCAIIFLGILLALFQDLIFNKMFFCLAFRSLYIKARQPIFDSRDNR